jgi:hypothetical protein
MKGGGRGEVDRGYTTPAREQWRADRNAAGRTLLTIEALTEIDYGKWSIPGCEVLHLIVTAVSEEHAPFHFKLTADEVIGVSFFFTSSFQQHYDPGFDSTYNRNE